MKYSSQVYVSKGQYVSHSPVKTPISKLARFCSVAILVGVMFCASLPVFAAGVSLNDVHLLAVTTSKAIVKIGGKRYVLKKGEPSPEGVVLVASDSAGATFSLNGEQQTLSVGVVTESVKTERELKREQRARPSSAAAPAKTTVETDTGELETVVLFADERGSFYADGAINDIGLRFLVDTGASIVAMSSMSADRAGIDYSKGRTGTARTASGTAPMKYVTVPELRIGEIVAYNVAVGIIVGRYPETPLLGMSFLNLVDMKRQGDTMELTPRW